MRCFALLAASAATLLAAGSAQAVNFGTATYTENFDTLASAPDGGTGTTLPAGFSFEETGGNANNSYGISTGSTGNTTSAGNTYSFGATGATERAFGTIQSGSLVSRLIGTFTNTTGSTVTALTVGYTGEQWRLGATGRADRLDFGFSTTGPDGTFADFDALDFVSPVTTGTVGGLNGNVNRTVLSSTLTGLNLANGASIYFQWSDFNAAGADDGLAIDDLNLTPTLAAATPAVPEPATWGMMLLGFGLLGSALRRRRVAVVAA